MTEQELARSVTERLLADPDIDADAIAVTVVKGVVALRGTVASPSRKEAATQAAERVPGVVRVDNDLDLQPLAPSRHEDDPGLRADVLQALMLDPQVPSSVDAHVRNGVVTLTGKADYQLQLAAAEYAARGVPGVADVRTEIELTDTTHVAAGVQNKIRKAMVRRAKLDADRLAVLASEGTVTLSGQVGSEEEHDVAVAAAWAAPGVHGVDDRLTVAPDAGGRPCASP